MSIIAGELARRWVPNWGRVARLQRSGPLRAFIGANLIAVLVILIRAQGWLQPLELLVLRYASRRLGRTRDQQPDPAGLGQRKRHRTLA